MHNIVRAGGALITALALGISATPVTPTAFAAGTDSPAHSASVTSTAPFEAQVPVLYYHRILCPPADATIPSLYECPSVFDAQMAYLEAQGWQTLTVDQVADYVAARECPPDKHFVVSIDDGAADGYDNAAPILESHGMRGSYFITSGVEGGDRTGKITWDQLRDLVARGHAIGNHTETHLSLNKQTPAVIHDQIEGAQQIFQEQLGFRPRTFAYPYGRYNDAVIAQVAASGFELGFTVHGGAREASDAPYVSKRIEVLSDDTGPDVLARIAPFAQGCRPATPDMSVSLTSGGPFKGDGVYAPGVRSTQTVTRKGVKTGKADRYWLRIDNDAQQAGGFSVAPTLDGSAGMDVRYTVARVDVTAAMNAGTYSTPTMQPWTSLTIVMHVTPLPPAIKGSYTGVTLRAVSVTDPTRVDVARVITKN